MRIFILKPCFTLEHFKKNIFIRNSTGRVDILCLIHALTFNVIFFERKGHNEANKIHLKS